MSTVVVRYRTQPDRADENQALVEAVFAELAVTDPGGVRDATFRLADATFVHIADVQADPNPLGARGAFAPSRPRSAIGASTVRAPTPSRPS